MKNVRLLIFSLLVLINCNPKNKLPLNQEIQGIWCNNFGICICAYFADENCVIEKAKIQKIISNDNSKLQVVDLESKGDTIIYEPEIIKDTLWLNKSKKTVLKAYTRCDLQHNEAIKNFKFSQSSASNEYSFELNDSLEFQLRIWNYHKIKKGNYKGQITQELNTYINNYFRLLELDKSNKLKLGITSDIQEWASIVRTQKGEEYKFYYNYENNKREHNAFGFAMYFLPFLLDLNEFSEELTSSIDEVENFRISEFNRNIKEINSKLDLKK